MAQYRFESVDQYASFLQDVVSSYPDAEPSDISLATLSTPSKVGDEVVRQQTVDYLGGGPLELDTSGTFDIPLDPQTVLEYSENTDRYSHLADHIQAHRAFMEDLTERYGD
jgi:hypothetical protein